MDWLIGLLASGTIAGLAYGVRSLSASGALAAVVVGTVLYALGSLAWFGTLILFFLTSSLLSKFKPARKEQAEAGYEKSGRRDAGQVLANGGLAALLCIGNAWVPDPAWWIAFLGVMATVTADTWATEVGGLSKGSPRSILTWREVPKGTSGGVSALGTLATLLGALFIGIAGWLLLTGEPERSYRAAATVAAALLAGTFGSLTDSLLGATLQGQNRCTVCERRVEARHHCGAATAPHRGWRLFNNDAVNLVSSLAGGLAALGIYELWQ